MGNSLFSEFFCKNQNLENKITHTKKIFVYNKIFKYNSKLKKIQYINFNNFNKKIEKLNKNCNKKYKII